MTPPKTLQEPSVVSNATTAPRGMSFRRRFSTEGIHPYDQVEWDYRSAGIKNDEGKVIFEQKGIEVPRSWSQLALNVVASKYFHGGMDQPHRETSVKQLIDRVVLTFTKWGRELGVFSTEGDGDVFRDELLALCVNQVAAFNSPVWFNVGIEEQPQCSACFINSVEDTMSSIMDLAKTEGMLFKFGSGTGTNFSRLRGSQERLSTGGWASGPVSFMRGYDAFAGVIKSGGKTRRAAKMVILDIDHPDIAEFIECKAKEEKKAWALIEAGYDGSFNGEAYHSVFFQNSNNSVRVTDEFMHAVVEDREWHSRARTDGSVMGTFRARELWHKIAEAAWVCGDPGLQYDTLINEWHTCKATGRISASNPCSEYMFLDDTACNLASLNLMKFLREDGSFDIEAYRQACHVVLTAMEIIVDKAGYPREMIAQNSHLFRPLGLGYANLGALLMAQGLAYDSEAGRAWAAALTAIMCGQAYATSAELAEVLGPFPGYAPNRESMLGVIRKHRAAVLDIRRELLPEELVQAAQETWDQALERGLRHGYRNSQVTVLAPTGTIGFLMDCDTTGIEPDLALVKYKYLAGGGTLKIVNNTISRALRKLGYSEADATNIVEYIHEHNSVEGCGLLKEEHLSVFDCSFRSPHGTRTIHYMGHVRMMAAVQPFLSGAISKTVNMPHNVTAEEIADTYLTAWKLGLKAVAIYRDGCKRSQPLNTKKAEKAEKAEPTLLQLADPQARRRKLPDERQSLTHKFSIAGHEGYITVGLYEDGTPGEIFITMSKEGSTLSGAMDAFATAVSLALQYGVPLEVLVKKFSHLRFEPSGFTTNRKVPFAKSIMDYIFRWMGQKYLPGYMDTLNALLEGPDPTVEHVLQVELPLETRHAQRTAAGMATDTLFVSQTDAPPCENCGSIMVRNGACYKCINCGTTSGCS